MSRWIKKHKVSKAEVKFAKYLRTLGYKISTSGSPANEVPYREFEPRLDRIIDKNHDVDILLEEHSLPIELFGPHHQKQRQEIKDERIMPHVEKQFGKKPVIIRYDGKEPSTKKMREWHKLIQAHLVRNETIVYYEL